jgi:ABC-type multidrug transport system fused ATPase/permease subunit
VEQLQSAFSITLAEFIRQIVVLVLGLVIIAWLAPHLSLIMLLTFPVIVISSMFFGRYIRKLSRKRQDALANTNIIVEESFQAFPIVKAFTNEKFEIARFVQSITSMVSISMNYAKMRGLFFIFIITVLFGGLFFILWRGALMVQAGEMQAGDLFSFIIYTGIIGGAIAGIGNLYSTLAGSIGATERIQDILDRGEEISNTQLHAESNLKLNGEIVFDQVSFSYPSRTDVTVLKNINLNVKKGERIALVGQSGAGKSTIAQLVMRFYHPLSGSIFIDGREIDSYDLLSFRKNLAIVPQDVLLFGGTIRENILYGKPGATESELNAAAEQSNCMEFISGFPDGFDTVVGERGIKLSGGQKQRIAIARSILRDPSILILDEATSSLDSESEKIVQDALDKLMKNRTSIIIAHRLSTIRDADRIYVLKDGQIAESGTHADLIAREGGIYKSLVSLQMEKESF